MAKRFIRADLFGTVLVPDPAGGDSIVLHPGQEVPEGIEVGDHVISVASDTDTTSFTTATKAPKSGKASKKAKAAGKAADAPAPPAAAPEGAASSESELLPPPKNGAGSGTEAWRHYAVEAVKAAGLKIDIPADANRADIISGLEAASIRTE